MSSPSIGTNDGRNADEFEVVSGNNPSNPPQQPVSDAGSKDSSNDNNNNSDKKEDSKKDRKPSMTPDMLRNIAQINAEIKDNKNNPVRKAVAARRAAVASDLAFATQSASWTASSLLMFVDSWRQFLTQNPLYKAAGIYLLPVAILSQGFEAMFDWAAFRNQKATNQAGWHGTLAKAITNTLSFAAMATAVVGALAFASLFTVIAPALMTGALAAKSLYHFGAAAFYQFKMHQAIKGEASEDLIKHYSHLRTENALLGVSTGLTASAFGVFAFIGKPVFAILGAIGGAMSVVMGLGNATMNKMAKPEHHKVHPAVSAETQATNEEFKATNAALKSLYAERKAMKDAEKSVAVAPAVKTEAAEKKSFFNFSLGKKQDKQVAANSNPVEEQQVERSVSKGMK